MLDGSRMVLIGAFYSSLAEHTSEVRETQAYKLRIFFFLLYFFQTVSLYVDLQLVILLR